MASPNENKEVKYGKNRGRKVILFFLGLIVFSLIVKFKE